MKSLLICDTTKEEREQIVADCLDAVEGACEACAPGIADMYQAYIDGTMELKDVNMAFHHGYTTAISGPDRAACEHAQ